jgi:hypothetical protein
MKPSNRQLLLLALLTFGMVCGCSSKPSEKRTSAPEVIAPVLFPNMGSLHHSIDTTSSQAQQFFDQGLTFVYAFNFEEAVRSFKTASQFDPRSPMPYWGIAEALGPNYHTADVGPIRQRAAFEAIQKAKDLVGGRQNEESAYVEALSQRITNDSQPDIEKLDRRYAVSMGELRKRFPDDPDAATLYAESLMDLHRRQLWTNDGKPNENTLEIISVIEEVLRRWPDHVGANHFYIHTMEASPYPERALRSAKNLESSAPAAGHLVHMPAHIYMRVGEYAAAVRSNQMSATADREYLRNKTIANIPYVLGYAEHNLLFLTTSAGMDGEFDTAYKAALEPESEMRAILPNWPQAELYLSQPLLVLLRFARWDEILAVAPPQPTTEGLTFFWHYGRGCAFAGNGHAQQAAEELDAMEKAYLDLPSGRPFQLLPNTWATLHELAQHALAARIATAKGDERTAVAEWSAAVAVEDRMQYHEPADWYYPVRESLGAALLRNGQAAEAAKVFRDELSRDPGNPRALFGIWKVLVVQKKTVDAARAKASFAAAWKGGKDDLRIENF